MVGHTYPPLPFLDPDNEEMEFPPLSQAWGQGTPAPGLLAMGGDLSLKRLQHAYRQGIFPWFGKNEPIMWWSTDPRMVLYPQDFKISHSLKKTLRHFLKADGCEIRIDCGFKNVISACSEVSRKNQDGTWIIPEMIDAYVRLHEAGMVHSFETWVNNKLVGGLYGISIGGIFYGESMFSYQSDASKLALCGLVAFARFYYIELIDCQQKTAHLTSLGGRTVSRERFIEQMRQAQKIAPPNWEHRTVTQSMWETLLR